MATEAKAIRSASLALRHIAGFAVLAGTLAVTLAAVEPAPGYPAAEGRRAGGLTGRLLVARPGMSDPRFSGTVIYMVRHDANGALGLVVNRPLERIPIALLLDRLGLGQEGASGTILAHFGGPVEPGAVFVLHTADHRGEGSQVVGDGFALSRDPAILRAIGADKGPRRVLLALGYSGWAPGQLEGEIEAGGWVSVPADPTLVFDDDHGTKWERAMALRGLDL
jgi:putative transcriptional regulator